MKETFDNAVTGPSFSLKNRVAREIWNMVYAVFFRYSPRPFHAWRRLLLQLFGAKIGRGTHVYPKAKIWAPWNVEIGEETGIADGVTLYAQDKIIIGNKAVISQGSYICAGTHDYTKQGFPLYTRPIYIDDHVWIAAECFVHPGVHIYTGAVIGARSVVAANMPEWKICVGFPCKPVKDRVLESIHEQY